MRLRVFVDETQLGDRGLLTVGDVLESDLRGFPVGYLAFPIPRGTKVLRRTGVFEYLFGGEIRQVRSETIPDHPGHVWQQVLLDCGLPMTIHHIGWGPLPLRGDLDAPKEVTSTSVGAYIGGVVVLMADISFFSPRRLAPGVDAKVIGVEVMRVKEGAVIEAESVRSIDFLSPDGKGALGAILEIDVERV